MNNTPTETGPITARDWAPQPGAAVRNAATVIVLRTHDGVVQVLLMRRAPRDGDIHSGACVFPGGLVDAADRDGHALCDGIDDAQASARLGLDANGLDYYVAALREVFEESGLLIASTPLDVATIEALADERAALNKRQTTLPAICARFGLRLAADRIVYSDHWLTPPGVPKRYDTRFFIAEAPARQVALQDDTETDAQLWLTPAEALERRRELKLAPPTVAVLRRLETLPGIGAMLEHAHTQATVPRIMPRLATGAKGLRPVMPDEPAWAEIGHVDPDGHGRHGYELTPGVPVRLSPRLIRITANNGSMMTGPGTNCYLIGGGERNEWAALDPGPLDDTHVQAIVDAAPGPIRWIFVTHTHKDHSPAVQSLHARTGAQRLGMAALHEQWQDTGFVPDVALRGGESFDLPGDSTLQVIHTPGPRRQPPVLPAGAGTHAVHRRPRDAGLDRGHQPARRRHERLPEVAARTVRARPRLARARARFPDGAAAAGDRTADRPPAQARDQGAGRVAARHPAGRCAAGAGVCRCAAETACDGAALAARAPAQAARRRDRRGRRRGRLAALPLNDTLDAVRRRSTNGLIG